MELVESLVDLCNSFRRWSLQTSFQRQSRIKKNSVITVTRLIDMDTVYIMMGTNFHGDAINLAGLLQWKEMWQHDIVQPVT